MTFLTLLTPHLFPEAVSHVHNHEECDVKESSTKEGVLDRFPLALLTLLVEFEDLADEIAEVSGRSGGGQNQVETLGCEI